MDISLLAATFSESLTIVQDRLGTLWEDTLRNVPEFVAAIIVLGLTWVTAKVGALLLKRILRGRRLRRSLQDLFRQLFVIAAWVVGFMTATIILFPGMTPAKVLTVLGLSSVAVGFAFKDIFENFFAGVLILWRFPFENGDFIVCGDVAGKVVDVEIRMTHIMTTSGELIVLPNAKLFKEPVEILTHRPRRRITIICGVAYDEDVDQARDVIRKALEGCESVSREHDTEVFAQEFAESSVNFEVTWWAGSTPLEVRKSTDEVVSAVKKALDNAGIEIPFPYRTLTFKQPIELSKPLGQEDPSSNDG